MEDNSNEDTDKYASHIYAVLENRNDKTDENGSIAKPVQSQQNILPAIYSLATAIETDVNEMTVQLSGSNVNENKE